MAMKSPSQKRTPNEKMPHPKSPGNRGIDVEAELGIQPVRRPQDIEHDVNDLGQKKRVSSVLTSPVFKEELETVVTDLLRSGDGGGHVIAREIANFLSPFSRSQNNFGDNTLSLKTGVGCVSPINDITGSETARYNKDEKLLRCKLAALYRLVDLNGWSQSIYNHISLRVSSELEHFLINPFGLLYHEVSASKLLKITMQGELVDQGTTTFILNKPGFSIHSAIHSYRPDLKCVIHVHTPDVIAVSSMECGLLPLSQEAMIIGDVSYHSYHGMVLDQKEKKLLQKHLGPNNKVMFLRNHGLVACGETVEEAYHYLYHVMLACQAQVKAMSCMKTEKLIQLDKSMKAKTHEVVVNKEDQMTTDPDDIKYEVGELMFEANMRMLDNMGYRTGYTYRNITPLRKSRGKSDIELPGSSPIHLDDIQEGRSRLASHPPHSRWVNSPNQYTKVQAASELGAAPGSGPGSMNGDMSPKSKTKWRNEEGSANSTPIHIVDPNQFVPKNTDPREVVEKRKKIRGQGRWDENRPGPQSQKLDGVGPTDRRGLPSEGILTGSKGIIQRGYEDVEVVTGPPNPFAKMSEEEIAAYRQEVEKKTKKDSETDEGHETEEKYNGEENLSLAKSDEPDGVSPPSDKDVTDHKQEKSPEPQAPKSEPPAPQVEPQPVEVTLSLPPKTEPPKPKIELAAEKPPVNDSNPPKEVEKRASLPKTDENTNKAETPAPKSKEPDVKPKTPKEEAKTRETPDGKDEGKGKGKKNKKRRSLSFLKKNKKEKE